MQLLEIASGINNIMENLMEKLRPLVGLQAWDYCVFWKLSQDQRFIDWMDCCCGGSNQSIESCGELMFPVSPVLPCRDTMTRHPRTNSCDLLSQLPSSIPLESGIYLQTLLSNQPKWLNNTNSTESGDWQGTFGTKVLVPVPCGLIELFGTRQVYEDQNVIDFITAQCSLSMERQLMVNPCGMAASFEASTANTVNCKQYLNVEDDQREPPNHFRTPHDSTSPALESVSLPYDISLDQIHLCSSPMNFSTQFHSDKAGLNPACRPSAENGFMDTLHKSVMSNTSNMHMEFHPFGNKDQTMEDKDLIRNEKGRSDSISDCSDQTDDEDDVKHRRRTGKGQSKNLFAERNRRKKLNERLYALRALVPKISKLDRASILGDAIEFVKDLQNQEKELQDELNDHSDTETGVSNLTNNGNHSNVQTELLNQNGVFIEPKRKRTAERTQDSESFNDKAQQMEPQVEVAQIDGNEFFVKVFCEHKAGGFVRLMEALSSLGLEVTHANVTSFRKLVSNVFKVEKKDSEMVQADHVRDSLLELTRNQGTVLRGFKRE